MTDLLSPGKAPMVLGLALPGTLIVLDFDGTLTPIVGDRRSAGLSERTRAILRRLARLYPVAILSGRAAEDVRTRLDGVDARWVVGSHGAEWPGEGREHRAWRNLVGRWRATLARRLAGADGVEIEVKPLSLAVHYRLSREPGDAVARIGEAVRDLPGASVVLGKKVLNLVPEGAGDKGTALRRLVGEAGAERVLFIGDDVTDEAAFAARLDIPAVMVRVGRDLATRAGTWLRRRSDVDELLDRLCLLREVHPASPTQRLQAGSTQGDRIGSVLGFMEDLRALEQGLNRRSKAMLNRQGVTGPQRLAVRVVGRLGSVRPAQLARLLHSHPSSVTRLVRTLEARDLIRRIPDPRHRGRVLLEVGPKAGRVERLRPGTVESAVQEALDAASPRDIAATRRVLGLVTRRLVALK